MLPDGSTVHLNMLLSTANGMSRQTRDEAREVLKNTANKISLSDILRKSKAHEAVSTPFQMLTEHLSKLSTSQVMIQASTFRGLPDVI